MWARFLFFLYVTFVSLLESMGLSQMLFFGHKEIHHPTPTTVEIYHIVRKAHHSDRSVSL